MPIIDTQVACIGGFDRRLGRLECMRPGGYISVTDAAIANTTEVSDALTQ